MIPHFNTDRIPNYNRGILEVHGEFVIESDAVDAVSV